jgi:probable F420-dependent oxidoreductase
VRFGAKIDNYGTDVAATLADRATRAEQAGFDSLWLSDHVVMPVRTRSRYPYSSDGSIDWDPSADWFDAVVALAVMAMATSRAELGTGVLVPALRRPLVLGKQLASVDALSGGRVVLGAGAGWLREEFDALGVPFERRGQRLDECIALLRDCWSGRAEARSGPHYALPEPVFTFPTPARPIPIIVGGMSEPSLRRAALVGDGWFPLPGPGRPVVEVVGQGVARIRALAEQAGRAFTPRVILNAYDPRDVARQRAELTAAGVTDAIVDVDFADPEGPERAVTVLRS